jgi:hypothetical protein
VNYSSAVTVQWLEANDAQDAALEAALLLLWELAQRDRIEDTPIPITDLFGTSIIQSGCMEMNKIQTCIADYTSPVKSISTGDPYD